MSKPLEARAAERQEGKRGTWYGRDARPGGAKEKPHAD